MLDALLSAGLEKGNKLVMPLRVVRHGAKDCLAAGECCLEIRVIPGKADDVLAIADVLGGIGNTDADESAGLEQTLNDAVGHNGITIGRDEDVAWRYPDECYQRGRAKYQ